VERPPASSGKLLSESAARRIVGADLASLFGDYLVVAAMPFAVLSVGGSPGWVAAVLAVQGLSLVALLPIGGVLGDRFPRRSVMVGADLLRLGSQTVLAVLLLTGNGSLWLLVAAQVIHGIGTGLFMPAASAVVPDVVRGDSVQGTYALKIMVRSVAMALGPALGAAAVALSGAGVAMAADGGTFALSAALLWGLDVGERDRAREEGDGWLAGLRRWGRQFREGWRDFLTIRWMRWTTLQFALVNAAVIAPFYVFGPTASEEWFDGAGSWALILVGLAVGQFVGAAIGMNWRPRRPLVSATLVFCLWAVPLVVLASQVPLTFVVGSAAIGGTGMAMFLVLWETTAQTYVRPDARSRVSSFEQFGSLALVPFGFGLGGWMQETIGTTAGLLVGAATLVVAAAAVIAAPSVRDLRSSRNPVGQPLPAEGSRACSIEEG
jgi:predicted MFS family arabinose efflux permease